jgi:AcrR family transcriptional regulator
MPEPRLGRPRSTAAHGAILAATRQLLAENGYAEVSMERVAARAGVGKQTVYRRWASKAPLVAEAVLSAYRSASTADLPDSGDLAADLRSWLSGYTAFLATPDNAALVRALAAAAADDLQDGETLYRQLTGPQHEAIRERFRRGVQAGQVRADADLEAAAEAVIGVTLYRMLTPGDPDRRFDGLIDVLIAGIRR